LNKLSLVLFLKDLVDFVVKTDSVFKIKLHS